MSYKEPKTQENKGKEEGQDPAKPSAAVVFHEYKDTEEEYDGTPPLWLVGFTDVMALMLTFFVLSYSMSSPELGKWEELTAGLSGGFDKFKSQAFEPGAQKAIEIEKIDMTRALDLKYLQSIVDQLVSEHESLKDLVLFLQKDRLIISFPEHLLFRSGQADVNIDGKRAIYTIGDILSRIRNRIEIIGHTDPEPIQSQSGKYKNNYELSLFRAVSVAAVLKGVGYKKPITARGLASARYDELSEAVDEKTRLSLSRRVDIVVLKNDGSLRNFINLESKVRTP